MAQGALMHLVSAYSPVTMNLVAIDRAEIDRRQRIINHNVINVIIYFNIMLIKNGLKTRKLVLYVDILISSILIIHMME